MRDPRRGLPDPRKGRRHHDRSRQDQTVYDTITSPYFTEQKRIAVTLREVDNLIATLERLVAKKQAIKQGMVQPLLTGRTRLPAKALS